MDIVAAYEQVGSYRGAAALCGTTHKTVRRVIEANRAGVPVDASRQRSVPLITDGVAEVIREKVKATDGRITAKRLLPVAQAAGYTGSARSLRRAVARVKAEWRRDRRVFRPWVAAPGEHLLIDWTVDGGWHVFCAVLPWSRVRFVRFAGDERQATTLRLLAECFETIGGVPHVVLSDRMGCLKGGVVANVVVPAPDYVRFAAHYGFRPDFCEAADPQAKGMVEALAGYVQTDLIVPDHQSWGSLADANTAARAWCVEVNGREHAETRAVPAERLAAEQQVLRPLPSLRPALRRGEVRKVDKLATVRFGAARYSVPAELVGVHVTVIADEGQVIVERDGTVVACHRLVAPGEVSIIDDHYGGPRRAPARAIRPRSTSEKAFLAFGPPAEAFLRAAAAAGTNKLGSEIGQICDLEAAYGREALIAAIERAVTFRRFKAADVQSILDAGTGIPSVVGEGDALVVELPTVPVRSFDAYRLEGLA